MASFACEICTGSFASRPIVMISSIACQNAKSSLRMWLMYRPPYRAETLASAMTSARSE